MLIAAVSNVVTAISYFAITLQLIHFVRNSKLMNSYTSSDSEKSLKKQVNLHKAVIALVALFASFISLCGLTHALGAAQAFYPDFENLREAQMAILIMCSIVSLTTSCVCFKIFPVLSRFLPKFELDEEGNLEHAGNYMVEIVDMVMESIMVLSPDLKIVRKNEASKSLFGTPQLIGKSILDFIHPEDLQNFKIIAGSAMASYTTTPITIEYRIKPVAHVFTSPSNRSPIFISGKSGKSSRVHCDPGSVVTAQSSFAYPFSKTSSMASLLEDCSTRKSDPSVKVSPSEYVWVESTILKHTYADAEDELHYTLEMVTRNIEERRKKHQNQFEIIRKETEEQTRVNAAKMRYLSCIAHDLKTPLQSFCYSLDLLQQTKLRNEQREFIHQATVAVDLMKLTISQTMDISKALTGAKLAPRRATVYLSTVMKRVEMLIAGFGKQVPVSFVRAPQICDEIITDEEWLWQMLLNLLTNACKYTDKGSITVKVSLVDPPLLRLPERSSHPASTLSKLVIETIATPEMLLFEVIDTGVGVRESSLTTMFDAFAQVQEGQVTGTGLGLYGVRMRAEGLQGTCGARHNTESSTGTGTVMWFSIPYLPDRSRPNSFCEVAMSGCALLCSSVSTESLGTPRALTKNAQLNTTSELARRAQEILSSRPLTAMVVEDTLTVRKLMERMLLQMGFAKVVGCENGSKGLDAMMAEPVDIVFSDVQMPIMTGPEMVSRFRQFEEIVLTTGARSKRQIVVAVTANGSEIRDNSNSGFDDIYPKPLGRNDIYKIINEWL